MDAVSLNPSFNWAGNDGNWSTFALRIGEPPQLVNVLPSTSGSSIWVGIQGACDPVYIECPTRRGELFSIDNSTTFVNNPNTPELNLKFDTEEPLGYNGTAIIGLDRVAIGNEGNVISATSNSLIAVYEDNFPWVGLLGLEVQNETLATLSDTHESPLGSLNSSKAIPGAYWAYTAGAYWRGVYASLTFGGYDMTRGDISNALRYTLSDNSRNTVVSITGISISAANTVNTNVVNLDGSSLLAIDAFIDSVVTEIWLPMEACRAFETAFNLTWNETLSMYLVDDALHSTLLQSSRDVTFTLTNGTNTTDIVLPYVAFDHTATFPLAGIRTSTGQERYFPLKRASDTSQIYLGRTFLQSAYLAVDYEREEFAITQALYPGQNVATDVKTVSRPVYGKPSKDGLSIGAIVGMVIGGVVLLAILGGLIFTFWRKRKNTKKSTESTSRYFSSISGTTIEGWAEGVSSGKYVPPKGMEGEEEDQFKSELDARDTARAPIGFIHRHELSAGTIRRTSQQSGFSRGSGVSQMVDQRRSGQRWSDSPFGVPSPGFPGSPESPGELSGVQSPVSGQASPPLASPPLFGGRTSPMFELHADSSPLRTTLPTAHADPMELSRPLSGERTDESFLPAARNVSPVRVRGGAGLSRSESQTETPDVRSSIDVRPGSDGHGV